MTVRFEAEIIAIDGQRVTFQVAAWDEKEKVAEGTHERFVVDVERFAAVVQAKGGARA
jgi:predicted thioesterase